MIVSFSIDSPPSDSECLLNPFGIFKIGFGTLYKSYSYFISSNFCFFRCFSFVWYSNFSDISLVFLIKGDSSPSIRDEIFAWIFSLSLSSTSSFAKSLLTSLYFCFKIFSSFSKRLNWKLRASKSFSCSLTACSLF